MADDLKEALHDAGLDRIDASNLLDELGPLSGTCVGTCTQCNGHCCICDSGNSTHNCC